MISHVFYQFGPSTVSYNDYAVVVTVDVQLSYPIYHQWQSTVKDLHLLNHLFVVAVAVGVPQLMPAYHPQHLLQLHYLLVMTMYLNFDADYGGGD
jgi:hypothetical protein